MIRLALFVSPHGFGHAARTSAVMQALADIRPDLEFHVFTGVPAWFFKDSVRAPVVVHDLWTDVGMVQHSALHEDIPATIARLREFIAWVAREAPRIGKLLQSMNCHGVVADISALGIAAAREAGLPCVLVENFTWDWIYERYGDRDPVFADMAAWFARHYRAVDLHIQTAPWCADWPSARKTGMVFREARTSRPVIRQSLGIPQGQTMVLLTMGGLGEDFDRLKSLDACPGYFFVIPGGASQIQHLPSAVLLPKKSSFFHPDLVAAADVVLGKLGYSTLAECAGHGRPFVYIPRSQFPESPALEAHVQRVLLSAPLTERQFFSESWVQVLAALRHRSDAPPPQPNAAHSVARWILETFDLES